MQPINIGSGRDRFVQVCDGHWNIGLRRLGYGDRTERREHADEPCRTHGADRRARR